MDFDLGPVVVKADQTPDTSACEDTVAETPSPAAKESVDGSFDQDFQVSFLSSSPHSPANSSHGDEEDGEAAFLEQVESAMAEMEQKRQVTPPKMEKTQPPKIVNKSAKESVHGNFDQDFQVSLLSSYPHSPTNSPHGDEEDDEATFLEQVESAIIETEQKRHVTPPKMEKALEDAEAHTPLIENKHFAVSPSPSSDESTVSSGASVDEGSLAPIRQPYQATSPAVNALTLDKLSRLFPSPKASSKISESEDHGSSEEEELVPSKLLFSSPPQPPKIVNKSTTNLAPKALFTEPPKHQEPAWKRPPSGCSSEDGSSEEEEVVPRELFSSPGSSEKEEVVPSQLVSSSPQPPKSVNQSPTNLAPKALFTEPPKHQDPAWKHPPSYSSPPGPALYDNASRYYDSLKAHGQQPVLKKEPAPTTMTGLFLPASLGLATSPPSRPVPSYRFDDEDALSTTESSICPFDCVEDYKNNTFPEPTACILRSNIPHPSELLSQKENDAVSELGIEGGAEEEEVQKRVSKKPVRRLTKIISKIMGKGVPQTPTPREQEQEQTLKLESATQDSTELPIGLDTDSSMPIDDRQRLAKQQDDQVLEYLVGGVQYSISESFSMIGDSLSTIVAEYMPNREVALEDNPPAPPQLQLRLPIDDPGSLDLAYDESQEMMLKGMARAEEEDFEKQQPEPESQLTNSKPKSEASSSKRKWTWCIILTALLLIIIIVASVWGVYLKNNE
jgi:hypothetical protein